MALFWTNLTRWLVFSAASFYDRFAQSSNSKRDEEEVREGSSGERGRGGLIKPSILHNNAAY